MAALPPVGLDGRLRMVLMTREEEVIARHVEMAQHVYNEARRVLADDWTTHAAVLHALLEVQRAIVKLRPGRLP